MTKRNTLVEVNGSRIAFDCPWYRVRQDQVTWPDGSAGVYNVVEASPCVFIVPVTPDGEIVLIHQYRHTTGRWVWEIPAGAINDGQSMLDAAKMELREEVGGVSDSFNYLGEFETANGRSNEVAHLFLARDVVLGENELESAEILTVHPTALTDVQLMIRNNQIKDAPSLLAISLSLPLLRP